MMKTEIDALAVIQSNLQCRDNVERAAFSTKHFIAWCQHLDHIRLTYDDANDMLKTLSMTNQKLKLPSNYVPAHNLGWFYYL